jgi:hypothetical protein
MRELRVRMITNIDLNLMLFGFLFFHIIRPLRGFDPFMCVLFKDSTRIVGELQNKQR